MHLAIKRSAADKPIVRAFCDDLFNVYGLNAEVKEPLTE
jgi:hypothetical protein